MFGSRITKGKSVKIRAISAFKPNTPLLQHSYILHAGITQIATDIPITNGLDSYPLEYLKFQALRRQKAWGVGRVSGA
jgi:hypothetical protein